MILKTLNCFHEIDQNKYGECAYKTGESFLDFYAWYYMPSSNHKMIIQGSEIISTMRLPIGKLAEQAQESRNKQIRQIRSAPKRKFSRVVTKTDLLNRLLITSDPYISSIRKELNSKPYHLPENVLY